MNASGQVVPPPAAALRVIVVDDEMPARLRLRQLLAEQRNPAAQVAAEFEDASAALQWLQAHPAQADVLLADIRMPGRDGLQLAAAMQRLPQPPALIFVSAHTQHALRAFELQALDYLPKPVRRERLAAALARVPLPTAALADAADAQAASLAEAASPAPVLVVAERGRVLRIPAAEVLYLRAELKYVTLRTAHSSHLLDDSLNELQTRLGEGFLRVHRNALVAVKAMRELALRPQGQVSTAAADGGPAADDADAQSSGDPSHHGGADAHWALRVAPVDEWLSVSRRQLAAVRAALGA